MTRRDYIRFASLFSGERAMAEHIGDTRLLATVEGIIGSTADIFAADNELFDRKTFYLASGLPADSTRVLALGESI